MTNIPFHKEYKCEKRCGYGCVWGASTKGYFNQIKKETCPRCGSDLEVVNDLGCGVQ